MELVVPEDHVRGLQEVLEESNWRQSRSTLPRLPTDQHFEHLVEKMKVKGFLVQKMPKVNNVQKGCHV